MPRLTRPPWSLLIPEITLIISLWTTSAQSEQLKTHYGLLHAHTAFSDGSGTPEEAYASAKAAGLDFFAVTEHNHEQAESGAKERRDGLLIATNQRLYNHDQRLTVTRRWKADGVEHQEEIRCLSLVQAARQATDEHFVALYGQEFSTISSGNHVNVFEVDHVLALPNGDYRSLYAELGRLREPNGSLPIVQLNHPDVHNDLFYRGNSEKVRKAMFNDYGIDDHDYGPAFSELVGQTDAFVALIEILSGPALTPEVSKPYRYDDAHENDYYFYQTQGFHLSPSAGQDNHYPNWGTLTNARVGVLAPELTREQLLEGIRRNRTFATEDKNLDIRLQVNGEWMGSSLQLEPEAALRIEVTVQDAEEAQTKSKVVLYRGTIEPQSSDEATEWRASDNIEDNQLAVGNSTVRFAEQLASGEPEFIYVKVIQADGDRPGPPRSGSIMRRVVRESAPMFGLHGVAPRSTT